MSNRKFCFSCDLVDDHNLINEYKLYHTPQEIWSEVVQSLKDAGVIDMQIFLTGNRMFMVMEVDEHFSIERKANMDHSNPKVQEWEELMWNYQQALPWAEPGEKWVAMEEVFDLNKCI